MSAGLVNHHLCKSKPFVSILRHYSNVKQQFSPKYNKFAPNHPYLNLFPFKTRDEFVNEIEKSIIYNKDGLIAINKPFGIPINRPNVNPDANKPRTVMQTISTCGIPDCEYSMEEILPMLMKRLNLRSLSIVKSPERYTSGIMLLAASKNTADAISKALRRSQAKQVAPYDYWAITTFIPQSHQKLQKVGIRMVDVKEFNHKVPVIEAKVSNTSIKSESVTPVFVEMKILTVNNLLNTALVKVTTSKTTMHFLRVYMAHKLAPILGDVMYSSRVKTVLGKPVTVSPFNKAAYDTRLLSDVFSRQLQMPQDKAESIPTHLHLHQVTLDGFVNKEPLILNCSPPQYFNWSLNRLGMTFEPQVQLKTAISNQCL